MNMKMRIEKAEKELKRLQGVDYAYSAMVDCFNSRYQTYLTKETEDGVDYVYDEDGNTVYRDFTKEEIESDWRFDYDYDKYLIGLEYFKAVLEKASQM